MRKKRFTAFLLSLAMAGTSLYTCGVIDVQAAAVAEEGAEDQILEQLAEIQEESAAIEEDGAEVPDSEEVAEPEQQAAADENVSITLTGDGLYEKDGTTYLEWGKAVNASTVGTTQATNTYLIVNGVEQSGAATVYVSTRDDLTKNTEIIFVAKQGDVEVARKAVKVGKRQLTKDMVKIPDPYRVSYNGDDITNENQGAKLEFTVSDDAVQTPIEYLLNVDPSKLRNTGIVEFGVEADCDTHEGEVKCQVEIVPKAIDYVKVSTVKEKYEYQHVDKGGTVPDDTVTVTDAAGLTLDPQKDYTIAWSNNISAGDQAKAIVTLKSGGRFVSSNNQPGEIVSDNVFEVISKNDAVLTPAFKTLTTDKIVAYGKTIEELKNDIVVSYNDISVSVDDFDVQILKGKDVLSDDSFKPELGTGYQVKVTGKRNFATSSNGTLDFDISGEFVSPNNILLSISSGDSESYNGLPHEPVLKVSVNKVSDNGTVISTDTLSADDYDVTYTNSVNAASANAENHPTATVSLKGNYRGNNSISYNILPASINELGAKATESSSLVYDGSKQVPTFIVSVNLNKTTQTLVNNTDYKVVSTDATDAGVHTCKISGNGNYQGEVVVSYNIAQKDITTNNISWVKDVDKKYGYTGNKIEPKVEIEYTASKNADGTWSPNRSDRMLTEDTDYELIYGANKSIGTIGTVTISGMNNYTGKITKEFEITPPAFTSVSCDDIPYMGKAISAADLSANVHVYSNDTEIAYGDGSNYKIIPQTNSGNVGPYTFEVSGNDSYYNAKISGSFNVVPRDISTNTTIQVSKDGTYGKGCSVSTADFDEPVLIISDNNADLKLTRDVDYSIEFKRVSGNGATAGKYIVTGKGNYGSVSEGTFGIYRSQLKDVDLSVNAATADGLTYTGEEFKVRGSDLEVYDNKHQVVLSYNIDYRLPYITTVKDAGPSTIEIQAKDDSDYLGSTVVSFDIKPRDLSDEAVKELFTEEYKDNVVYAGKAVTYTVSQDLIAGRLSYNGMELSANDYDVMLKKGNEEPSISYNDVGEYAIVAVGRNNYTGVHKLGTLTVGRADLPEGFSFYGGTNEFEYTGSVPKPAVLPPAGSGLIMGQDYEVDDSGVLADVGKYDVIVRGINNYQSEIKLPLIIGRITLSEGNTKAYYAGKDASGNALVQVTVEGKVLGEADCEITVTPVAETNKWSVTIKGNGVYEGTVTVEVEEGAITILNENVSVTADFTYTGEKQAPKPEDVKVEILGKVLSLNTDYDVTVPDSINAGRHEVTVTGKGDYTGTANTAYTIKRASFTQENVTITESVPYTGSIVEPVTINVNGKVLVPYKDYVVTADTDLVSVGVKNLTITGIGNYEGTATGTCEITGTETTSLAGATVNVASATYTGSAQTAKVTSVVKDGRTLKEGTDYTVTPVSRTAVGKVSVTVTGKGSYTGTATGTFTINPRDISKGKVTGIKDKAYTGKKITQSVKLVVSGRTLKLNTDYTVSYKNNTNIGQATVTIKAKGSNNKGTITKTFKINPKKAVIQSLKAGNRSFTITAKKAEGGANLYRVQYKLKGAKNWTNNKPVSGRTQTVKNLKKGKTYTVMVRAYKKVNGKTYWGEYSKVMNVKVN